MDLQAILPMLPLWYAVFLLSATAHEAGHAAAARLGGDATAYLAGQASLNPFPHIVREPFGTVVVPILTFLMNGGQWMMGWASAPYDASWEDRHPGRAAMMALAGPAANLVLATIAFGVLWIGMSTGWWEPYLTPEGLLRFDRLVTPGPDGAHVLDGLSRLLSIALGLNTLLLVFNLLPIPPLDGATVVAGIVPPARRLRDAMRGSPIAALAGLVAAWYLTGMLFRIVYLPVVRALFGVWGGPGS